MATTVEPRVLYRWHNLAVCGLNPPVLEDDPQCGFFRLAVGELDLPVAIACRHSPTPALFAEIGAENDGVLIQGALLPRLWLRAASKPISERTYWDSVERLPADWRYLAECLVDDLTAEIETLEALAGIRDAQ